MFPPSVLSAHVMWLHPLSFLGSFGWKEWVVLIPVVFLPDFDMVFIWNAHAGFSTAFPTFFMHKAKSVSRDRGRHQGLELVWCQLGRWPWHEEFRETHRNLRPPPWFGSGFVHFWGTSLCSICRGYFTSEDGIIAYQHEILGALLIIVGLGKHFFVDGL